MSTIDIVANCCLLIGVILNAICAIWLYLVYTDRADGSCLLVVQIIGFITLVIGLIAYTHNTWSSFAEKHVVISYPGDSKASHSDATQATDVNLWLNEQFAEAPIILSIGISSDAI